METRPCKQCHEQIPKKAKRCKNCGGKQPIPFWKNIWFYVALIFLGPPFISGFMSGMNGEGEISSTEKNTYTSENITNVTQPKLELQNWNWNIEYNYATVEGAVKNLSDKKLENVQAVANFYTEDGDFISHGTAMLEYTTLLPGQTSPFRVMETANPAMSKATINFKKMFGGEIEHKEK